MTEMPSDLRPMLATAARHPPRGPGWAAEVKWDGARALAYCDEGELRLESRLGNSLAERFPEMLDLARTVPARQVVLDGEIVSFDPEGRPRFGLLQKRLQRVGRFDEFADDDDYDGSGSGDGDAEPGRLYGIEGLPEAVYLIFDLLYVDGRNTMRLPYEERRELLEQMEISGPHWRTPPRLDGDIEGLLEASRKRGLEGLIVKRLGSPYRPGARSRDWLKLKNVRRREFVIGGWLPGRGRRSERLGSLLVGGWVEPASGSGPTSGSKERYLHYGGRVGTGFDQEWLDILAEKLEPLRRETPPFRMPSDRALAPPRESVFVEPVLVAEVEYGEITSDGMLRHSAFKGLREDKPADEVYWLEA